MRVVAMESPVLAEDLEKDFSEIDEGIALLSASFIFANENTVKEKLAELTRSRALTIICEILQDPAKGSSSRIHIFKDGTITPAQQIFDSRHEEVPAYTSDNLYDVSYQARRRILALTRVGHDARNEYVDPYEGEEMADLLLIPDFGNQIKDTNDRFNQAIHRIVGIHGNKLKKDALIVHSNDPGKNNFIYSVKDRRRVGEKKSTTQGTKYVVHEF